METGPPVRIQIDSYKIIVNANERMELNFLREEVRKLRSMAGVSYWENIFLTLKS